MKRHLLPILGLVILTGCAASQSAMSDAPAAATASQPAVRESATAAAPVVEQRQDIFQSSKTFLAENLKKPGVKELPGGIQYRVLQAGSGASPTLADSVEIHYVTTRVDGSQIATTRPTKDAPPRTYQMTSTARELRQALLHMKPGARWEVVIPPSNRNKLTERNGALIYDLELVAVHAAAGNGS